MAGALLSFYTEEQWSVAAWWSRRVAVLAAFVEVIAVAGHRFGLIETVPFLWVLATVAALAVAALLLAAAGFQRVWHFGDRGGADLTAGLLLAALLLIPYGVAGWFAFSRPALSDISTDVDDPPPLIATATFRTPDMNPVTAPTPESRAIQAKAYPELTGRRYSISFEQTVSEVETIMETRGWQILSPLSPGSGVETTIEALANVPVLALGSDVAVRITDEGNAIYVDMRSASRYGRRDMGVNATYISGFLKDLDARANGLALPALKEQ
ncbi:MAG: DUF1499 domain-containing protein [Rhizobiaceae bacterium]